MGVPNLENSKPKPPDDLLRAPKRVGELIDWEQHRWNEDLKYRWFSEDEKRAILNIKIPISPIPDTWRWRLNRKGDYTVREAYNNSISNGRKEDQELCKIIWKIKASNKCKMFIWRLAAKLYLPETISR